MYFNEKIGVMEQACDSLNIFAAQQAAFRALHRCRTCLTVLIPMAHAAMPIRYVQSKNRAMY